MGEEAFFKTCGDSTLCHSHLTILIRQTFPRRGDESQRPGQIQEARSFAYFFIFGGAISVCFVADRSHVKRIPLAHGRGELYDGQDWKGRILYGIHHVNETLPHPLFLSLPHTPHVHGKVILSRFQITPSLVTMCGWKRMRICKLFELLSHQKPRWILRKLSFNRKFQ